jgi:hypothetical protein
MMANDARTDGRLSSWKLWLIPAAGVALLLVALVLLRETGVLCLWLAPDPGYLEVTTLDRTNDHLSLRLALLESKTAVELQKISIPGSVQRALELKPPHGFQVEEPLPPPAPTDPPEAFDAYNSYNADVHFVGTLMVHADAPVELRLPIRPTGRERGTVSFAYRGTSAIEGLCNSWHFVDVEIGVAVEQGVAPDEAR